ncbi:inosine/xanthosine triphosphatase [Lewinella sp. LCG006]|uniref:inosine/xanthosine triphosphatase n=1 Tax=Lewinella sp. LCG006 TaxID=3231911 RepID=UPI003460DEE6
MAAKIVVASKNPVKIASALAGFQEMFPEQSFVTEGISVPSGVSDQPLGDEETYLGAWNRVQAAKEALPDADFWIGIEGGNIIKDQDMEVMAWVIVLSKTQMGKARTAGFYLPPKVIELVNQGYELGHADDLLFGVSNSKQTGGSSGLLTDGVMDRKRFYVPAVILALIPFLKPELYA